jgi:hypothetical protein
MSTVYVNCHIFFIYICVKFSCSILLIFCYIQCRGPEWFFCPATLLTNEGLVQSANQRLVWRHGGIWIAWAASRVSAGKFPYCIWLLHAKCGGLEKYPSALHWIRKSTFELLNCAWLLSPGPSGYRHFPEQYMPCYWYSAGGWHHDSIVLPPAPLLCAGVRVGQY